MRTVNDITDDLKKLEEDQRALEKELNEVLLSKECCDARTEVPMMGNIGEWSEIYVFYRIMESGKLKPAAIDENGMLKEVKDAFLPVLKILREDEGFPIEYYTANDFNGIKALKIYYGNRKEPLLSCSVDEFSAKAKDLLDIIKTPKDEKQAKGAIPSKTKKGKDTWASFGIPKHKAFLNDILITKLKSPSTKINDVFGGITDITMEILQNDNMRVPVGFSIKSSLGSPSALFNYSQGSNAVYKLSGCTEEIYDKIIAINKTSSNQFAIDRIRYILHDTDIKVEFAGFGGDIFTHNLRLIADREPEVVAYSLLYSLDYPLSDKRSNRRLMDVLKSLEQYDPLNIGFEKEKYYKKRLKEFLFAKAGGMDVATLWDGNTNISGGYIFVTKKGDVLAFYASDQNMYKDWLLMSTKFDTPDSSDDRSKGFAEVFKQGNDYYLNLNVLIKFVES